MVNYQGRLLNTVGAPVNTVATVVLRIYVDTLSGAEIWSETHPSVTVSDNLFSVLLGSVKPLHKSILNGSGA